MKEQYKRFIIETHMLNYRLKVYLFPLIDINQNDRYDVGGHSKNLNMKKIKMIITDGCVINFKICVDTLNLKFDSLSSIYVNQMSIDKLTNLLRNTLESLT